MTGFFCILYVIYEMTCRIERVNSNFPIFEVYYINFYTFQCTLSYFECIGKYLIVLSAFFKYIIEYLPHLTSKINQIFKNFISSDTHHSKTKLCSVISFIHIDTDSHISLGKKEKIKFSPLVIYKWYIYIGGNPC